MKRKGLMKRWVWGRGDKWLSKDGCVPTGRPVRSGRVRKVRRGQRSKRLCLWGSAGWSKVMVIAVCLRELTDVKPSNKLCSATAAAHHWSTAWWCIIMTYIFYCLLSFESVELMLLWTLFKNRMFLSDMNAMTSCEWEVESYHTSTVHIFYNNYLLCVVLFYRH